MLALSVCLLPVFDAAAHEIPESVRLQMYVSRTAAELEVLLRVPLGAMRDISFAQYGPGYLDLAVVNGQLEDAVSLWLTENLKFDQDGRQLPVPELAGVRLSLPSDRSFERVEDARAHFAAPTLPADTELYWEQALMDVRLIVPLDAERGAVFLTPTLARLGLRTVLDLRYQQAPEPVRQMVIVGDPGRLPLVPAAGSVFVSFLRAGFDHVLAGFDHLLFLAALVLPVRQFRPLVGIVTAFTVAHSLTLAAAALGWLPVASWFVPAVELLVALSIVYMALENIILQEVRRRWLIAYVFGLVHGFAFSFALSEQLQFAGDYVPVALLAFNLGIEAGQLLVVAVALPLLILGLNKLPEKPTLIVLSALVAHSGLHWLSERFELLGAYTLGWPEWSGATLLMASRWMLLLVIAFGLAWLASVLLARRASR